MEDLFLTGTLTESKIVFLELVYERFAHGLSQLHTASLTHIHINTLVTEVVF